MPRIRVRDFETQGLEATDRVCESGWCDLVLDGAAWSIDRMGSSLHEVDTMPPRARAVHGITAAETQGFPIWNSDLIWATDIADGVDVVASFNVNFDGMFWGEAQTAVLCIWKASYRVWPHAPGHSNAVLRCWLEDEGLLGPFDPEAAQPAHRAGADAYLSACILRQLLQFTTAREMVQWEKQPPLYPRCPIGEWRDKPWSEVDAGFLNWMIRKPVEPDLVWNAQRELKRRAER